MTTLSYLDLPVTFTVRARLPKAIYNACYYSCCGQMARSGLRWMLLPDSDKIVRRLPKECYFIGLSGIIRRFNIFDVTFIILTLVSTELLSGKHPSTYKRWETLFVNHAGEKYFFFIWFTKVLSHRYIVEG